ncbi:hypothetical protein [Cellulomonas soli]
MSAATLLKEAPTVRTSTMLPVRTALGTLAVPSVLTLVDPLPGLPAHDVLELDALDDAGALFALRSTDDAAAPLRLFVVAPDAFFTGYTPDVAATAARLRAAGGEGTDAGHTVLVVVHPAGPRTPSRPPTCSPPGRGPRLRARRPGGARGRLAAARAAELITRPGPGPASSSGAAPTGR